MGIYCGKNTQMRRVIRELEEDRPELEKLRACCKLNVALVFTNGSAAVIRDKIQENKMDAPAKAGAINQVDVIIPKGMTTLEPTMTTFLQALNISSKITKGNIEILNDEHLLRKGEKCDASSAALLQKLGMMPFSYGLVTKFIYQNGAIFEPEVLDITDAQIIAFPGWHQKHCVCVLDAKPANRRFGAILHPPCLLQLVGSGSCNRIHVHRGRGDQEVPC